MHIFWSHNVAASVLGAAERALALLGSFLAPGAARPGWPRRRRPSVLVPEPGAWLPGDTTIVMIMVLMMMQSRLVQRYRSHQLLQEIPLFPGGLAVYRGVSLQQPGLNSNSSASVRFQRHLFANSPDHNFQSEEILLRKDDVVCGARTAIGILQSASSARIMFAMNCITVQSRMLF